MLYFMTWSEVISFDKVSNSVIITYVKDEQLKLALIV